MSCSNSYCPKCDKCNNCKECQQNWEECKDCKKCRQLQKPCGHNSMFPYVQQTQLNGIEFSINQNPPYGDKTTKRDQSRYLMRPDVIFFTCTSWKRET